MPSSFSPSATVRILALCSVSSCSVCVYIYQVAACIIICINILYSLQHFLLILYYHALNKIYLH